MTYISDKGSPLTCNELDNNFHGCEDGIDMLISRNYTATVAPTVGNDNTQGFIAGLSTWLNTTDDKFYKITDNTTGIAVWVEIELSGGELEKIETSTAGKYGYRYHGADASKYLSIGEFSLDFVMWLDTNDLIGVGGLHSLGLGMENIVTGNYCYVNGEGNIVSDDASIVTGGGNTATNGANNYISGSNNSLSGARNCIVKGSNHVLDDDVAAAIIIGEDCTATNVYSFISIGSGLEISSNYSIWSGYYNTTDSTIKFGIGNGDDDANRSNLIELREDGIIYIDKMVGTTAERPTLTKASSFSYLDTDLNKPIWYNGTDWIDAMGTVV